MAEILLTEHHTFAGDNSGLVHVAHIAERISWVRTSVRDPKRKYHMLCGAEIAPTWMGVAVEGQVICEDCRRLTAIAETIR